jgi:hypothetical protein
MIRFLASNVSARLCLFGATINIALDPKPAADLLDEKAAQCVLKELESLSICIGQMELKESQARLEQIADHLKKPTQNWQKYPSYDVVRTALRDLSSAIYKEMEKHSFVYIPQDRAKYFEQDALFGEEVNKEFSSVKADIKDAGNCLAAELDTGAVFHLLRVAEKGMKALARHLKIKKVAKNKPLAFGTWKDILKAIRDKIDNLYNTSPGAKRTKQLEFYSDLLNSLTGLKEWRDSVSHDRSRYDEHDAAKVLTYVSSFMQRLAERIHVLEAFPDDADDAFQEPSRIGVVAFVESERLLIEVSEQVKRLNADIGSSDSPLQQGPEVFKSVGVDMASGVAHGMIYHVVNVIVSQSLVGLQRVGVNLRAFGNVLANVCLKLRSACALDNLQDNARLALGRCTLQQSHHGSHGDGAGASDLPLTFVHVAGFAADESFIDFDVASKPTDRTVLNGETNPVQHEPRSLLSDTESTAKLARTDSVLGVDDHPECGKPLVEAERTLLEYGSNLCGVLALAITASPQPARGHKDRVGRVAPRAVRLAVRPAYRRHKLQRPVVVGEEFDCVLQCLREFRFFFHGNIFA